MLPSWAGKRRDANEQEIVDALRKAGASVYRLHEPVDLLVGYGGENLLMEVKPEVRWSFTDAELDFRRDWKGKVLVVHNVWEALRFIGAIT